MNLGTKLKLFKYLLEILRRTQNTVSSNHLFGNLRAQGESLHFLKNWIRSFYKLIVLVEREKTFLHSTGPFNSRFTRGEA